jgi:hypothetical protein
MTVKNFIAGTANGALSVISVIFPEVSHNCRQAVTSNPLFSPTEIADLDELQPDYQHLANRF